MVVGCWMTTDCSRAVLVVGDERLAWEAPAEETLDLRRRAEQAAAWCAAAMRARRVSRLPMLAIGIEEASCVWVTAPNRVPEVVGAVLKRRNVEWGKGEVVGLVEALPPARSDADAAIQGAQKASAGSRGKTAGVHTVVIQLPAAATQIFLDALDRKGVGVTTVCSFWHAMAAAWASKDGVIDAVVTADDTGRIVWAWASGGSLLACGELAYPGIAATDAHAQRKAVQHGVSRLVMDWLSWSAQLGVTPVSAVAVGASAEAIVTGVQARWDGLSMRVESVDDLVADALRTIAQADTAEPSGSGQTLAVLTRRATLAHRRMHLSIAAALVALAIGLAAWGVGMKGVRGQLAKQANALRTETTDLIKAKQPKLLDGKKRSKEKAVRAYVQKLRSENTPIADPPDPSPVFDELQRVLAVAAESMPEGAEMSTIDVVTQGTSSVDFNKIPTLTAAEQLRTAFLRSNGKMQWTGQILGREPIIRLELNGLWPLVEEEAE